MITELYAECRICGDMMTERVKDDGDRTRAQRVIRFRAWKHVQREHPEAIHAT